MLYGIAADLLIIFHFSFIIFVMTGAFLALKWSRIIYLHLPCALWGAIVELNGWFCPLTPYENTFRQLGMEAGYTGNFVEAFIVPLVYPPDLTRDVQILMGLSVIIVNLAVYGWIIYKQLGKQKSIS